MVDFRNIPDPANSVPEPGRAMRHERDRRAWELRAECKTLAQIRKILRDEGFGDFKETTLSTIVRRVDTENKNGMQETIASYRMRLVHRDEFIAAQALDAWTESRKPSVDKLFKERTNGVEGKENEDGSISPPAYDPTFSKEKSRKVSHRDGDAKFLAIALQANVHIAKLLGLEEPKRLNVVVDESAATLKLQERLDQAIEGLPLDKIRRLVGVADEIVQAEIESRTVDVEYRQITDQTGTPGDDA
jgi:hypothetical protein